MASMCQCWLRGGGTGPAGPVLAGPLFSDQVINIHKFYAVVRSKRTAAAQPLTVSSGRCRAWSSGLLKRIIMRTRLGGV